METEILAADLFEWKESAEKAANAIKAGQVVALPSETVYGLAASIHNEDALKMIFEVKERPSYDPLIVHIANISDLDEIADISAELRPIVNKLADKFWP